MNRMIVLACVSFLLIGCAPAVVAIPEPQQMLQLAAGNHRETISVPDVGSVKCAIRIDESAFDASTPTPLVLVLHYGYEGSKPSAFTGDDMLDVFAGAVREIGGIAIAPDVVGGDWTSEKNERSAVWLVESFMKTYDIDPSQVYVTGYSMGGEGVWHLAGRHQDLFTGAIPVAAPVAGGTDWKIPVYAIHSSKDEIVSFKRAKRHAGKVEANGGTIKFTSVKGLTHYDAAGYGSHVIEGVKWIRAQ